MSTTFTDAVTMTGAVSITGATTFSGSVTGVARSSLTQESSTEFPLNMTDARIHDAVHSPLPDASSGNDLGIGYNDTFGTNTIALKTADLKTAGLTANYARWCEVAVPDNYVAGQTLQIAVIAAMETTVAGTSATVDIECYRHDEDGTPAASDICATAAQSMNSLTPATYTFTITPATLNPGDLLDIRLTSAVTDAASGSAVVAAIYKVSILCSTKG